MGVLCVHNFLEVSGNAVKACGRRICGNWTYPIAFAWILPSIIGPVMLVTSKTVGNTLLSICRCRTHDPRLCTDCPPYASMCTLGLSSGLVIHGQIIVELCGLVGCCSQLLYQLCSQSEGLGIL